MSGIDNNPLEDVVKYVTLAFLLHNIPIKLGKDIKENNAYLRYIMYK